MIRASIDIGSNSVLLLACEYTTKIENEILNLSHITSLGLDLDKTGVFHTNSMDQTFLALKNYREELLKINFPIEQTIVTATEAARVARNAKEFFNKIKNELGFNIQIISGNAEAYFTAMGVASGLPANVKSCTIMDIGGASTELISLELNPLKILSSVSFPVGSVRARDWLLENNFDDKINAILSNDMLAFECETLVCVAGSMTSLASMFLGKKVFNDREIDGSIITFGEFQKFSIELQKTNIAELHLNFPFLGKRAPMVGAGSKVASLFGSKLKIKNMQISTRGLRYGVLINGGIDGA